MSLCSETLPRYSMPPHFNSNQLLNSHQLTWKNGSNPAEGIGLLWKWHSDFLSTRVPRLRTAARIRKSARGQNISTIILNGDRLSSTKFFHINNAYCLPSFFTPVGAGLSVEAIAGLNWACLKAARRSRLQALRILHIFHKKKPVMIREKVLDNCTME